MKNLMNIGKNLNKQTQAERESESRQKEAENYNLVGLGGYLWVVKYAVFVLLAALNFRLFVIVVKGQWGLAVAFTAILFEGFAIYGWHNLNRSAGAHQKVLHLIAYVFTGVSFIHASASFYELIGMGPSLGYPLFFYSHYIAFPLLFTMMTAGVCALYSTHWSSDVAKKQAEIQVQGAIGRADLIGRTVKQNQEEELARAEVEHYKRQLETEANFIAVLEEAVKVEGKKKELFDKITDPSIRKRMAEILERDDDGDGIKDVFQKPELRQEASRLVNGQTEWPDKDSSLKN